MAPKHAAMGRVREGLVAAVAAVLRAGDAVSTATTRPRSAIRSLLSKAKTRAARGAGQARSGRARKTKSKGGARESQTIKVTASTSSRDVTRKRRKVAKARKQSPRRPASPSRRGRRS